MFSILALLAVPFVGAFAQAAPTTTINPTVTVTSTVTSTVTTTVTVYGSSSPATTVSTTTTKPVSTTSVTSTTTTKPISTTTSTTSTLPTTSTTSTSVRVNSTTTVSSSTSSAAPTATNTKYVFAHHMVGNTYPYTVANWKADIQQAYASGIDGFALNMGVDSWQPARVADAYTAAQQSGSPFYLFISFDMTSLSCASPADGANLRSFITTYANHPNQFKYSTFGTPKPFASTFSGENCQFGQGSYQNGWQTQFYNPLVANGGPGVYFVPSFFVDPSTLGSQTFTNGSFAWNAGWPIQLTANSLSSNTDSARASLATQVGDLSQDQAYFQTLSGTGKSYLAAVSPWFFTHYSPQTYNKNWIYLADDHLYARRWESIMSARSQIPFVEIITWNDYGESHYVGPIEGAQPNSQAWVNGFDHQGWLVLTKYYAQAFKTGSYPAVTKDQAIIWARPHPRDATSGDSVARPTSYQLVTDAFWAVVLCSAPSTVTLSTSSTTSQTFQVPAGLSKLNMTLIAGNTMRAVITRGGVTVADTGANSFSFNPNPPSYNFNAYVIASP
ncbi:hypothetical protein SISNIDRAFT_490103 [Sistotremastrum niveocremeum HHB9708]|uniref:Glycoside hydrolase family 71 protein n=2 Tax=Sistotremastraceae TaxID=3402574 RepID=A0A164P9W0_9AGAM|nr:hypothetical protein SISNIDRAFT_490103 [Sistotremastrum niveocremeum HHB9708]KZT32734.1 hypothetical protein SISSUDRAFT_1055172 [Sistotremastrum suecicum HHB10207 ss-3]